METKLARIAEISRNKPKEVFTSIYHLINKEMLIECHKELDGKKATGLDGITKAEYEENLEENIKQLEKELKSMSYKPTPAKRIYIPKANGKMRGLAISIYEDKIVQLAFKKLIEAIYEPKLSKCMYGFRANRSCHDAIKELTYTIQKKKVSYVVDADIKGYFDHIDHDWLIKCIEQHIKDPRVIRMIKRFLKAGIIENKQYMKTTVGAPQGSILSPVLANIYMYYVLILWFEKRIQKNFEGESYIIAYADDFVCCFQYKKEAEQFKNNLLPERLKKFNLEIAEDKTRLIPFGRFAKENNKNNKTETFDFLGFTFYCSKDKNGWFHVKVKTSKKKYHSKIKEFKVWIKENRNIKIKNLISKINEKLRGHIQYFGVSNNSIMINKFRNKVIRTLFKWINRRSQKKSYTWKEFNEMQKIYPIVKAKVCVNLY